MLRLMTGLLLMSFAPFTVEQDTSPWIGKKVVAKAKTVLRIGNTVVDGDKVYRSYKVDQVNGDWLWLVSVSGLVGWVRSGDVVPFEQAIDYFTQEIHQNPSLVGVPQERIDLEREGCERYRHR